MPLGLRIAAFLRARFQAARHPRHAHRQMRAANAMLPARSLVVKPNLPEALARKRESGPAMLLELVILPAMNTALRTPKIIVATVHFVIVSPTQTTPKVSFVWSSRSGIVPSLDNGGPEARLRSASRILSEAALQSVATSCRKRKRSNAQPITSPPHVLR
jgi:hypothetical protein